MPETTVRVLPADVFDTLELTAHAFGGIGEGMYWMRGVAFDVPCCIHGHASYADSTGEVAEVLHTVGIDEAANDAVYTHQYEVLDFPTWCERLNVVRGA